MTEQKIDKKIAKALQTKLKEDVSNGVYEDIIPTEELKENIISNSKRVINHVLDCEELSQTIEEAIEGNAQLKQPSKKHKNTEKFKHIYIEQGFNMALDKTMEN